MKNLFTHFFCVLLTALFLLPWSGMKADEQTLTVASGSSTATARASVPLEGANVDRYQHVQIIYPKSDLTALKGMSIKKITFYLAAVAAKQWNVPVSIGLAEVNESYFSSTSYNGATLTTVYEGTGNWGLTTSFDIVFEEPFNYVGDNLLFDLKITGTTGKYAGANFVGKGGYDSYVCIYKYNASSMPTTGTRAYFIPKTTFTYEEAAPAGCTTPTGLTPEVTSSTSANVSWTAGASETAWQLQYREKGTSSWSESVEVSTTPAHTLTGLTTDKTYEVQVRSNCGEGDENKSDWTDAEEFSLASCPSVTGVTLNGGTYKGVTVNWTTGSATNCDVRYSADGGSSWTTAETNTSATSKTITGLSVGTEYTFQVKPNCSADGWVAAGETYIPAFPVPAPSASGITDAQATVSWSALLDNPNYKYIRVAAGSAAPDAAAWAAAASTASTSVTLTGLTGGTGYDVYVRAVYTGGEGEPAKVNFTTGKIAPTDLVQGATTTSSIAISWSYAGAATQFQWRSSKSGSDWSSPISVTNAVETGLSDGETYIFDVRAYYADGIYSSLLTGSFNTACAAKSLPYSCGFENSDADAFTNNGYNVCWKKIGSPYASTNSTYRHAGSRGLFIGGTEEQYAILPEFADAVKGMQITFWYKNYFPTYYASTLVLGSMTDPTDKTTFTAIKTLDASSSFVQIVEQSLASAGASDHYIAFKYTGSNQYSAVALDDITVTVLPSCPKPTSVSASSITSNSASISWTNGGSETAWKLQYSTDGSNWTDANSGNNITTNPYTLTELASATTYYARVKAVCGGSDASDWSDASAAFTTSCAVISSLPWTENFNNKTVDQLPLCWSAAGNTSAVSVKASSSYLTLPSKALYFSGSSGTDVYVLLSDFEADLSSLQIEFSHVEENNTKSGRIEVGYHDGTTFTPLRACDYSTSSSTWRNESAVTFPSAANGANIAFHYKPVNSGYTAAIDDITVSVAPSCAVPSGFGTSVIGVNSATVFWAADAASAWKLQYKAESDADWSAEQSVAATPSFELTGLAANTRYYVRVKADCGGGDVSEYSDGTFSFLTDCAAKTVTELAPWEYGFEDADANAMPACWERIEAYSGHGYPRVLNDSYNADAGDKFLYFSCPGRNAGFDAYTETAILPTFNEEIKKLQIEFNYHSSTGSKCGQLAVGYVVGNAFEQVQLLDKQESYTSTSAIEMPNDAPNGARIAIRCIGGNQGSSYTTYGYVDGISVSFKPACYTPTELAAAATSDGANVSWTDDAASQWNLRYSVKNADNWTTVSSLSATNYTISGLSTDNTYEVQVQADCGGSQSAWTASAEFQPACNAPTALAVTARTQTSATFSWTSSESAWKLQYMAEGDADWNEVNVNAHPFTLTGLTAGTSYQAKIQSACGSAFTDAVSFTTWCGVKDASELPIDITSFSALPECWEATFKGEWSGVSDPQIWFYGTEEQWLIIPMYDINLNQLSVTFNFSKNGPDPEFGYLDEPNGAFHAFSSTLASGVELDLSAEPAAPKYIAVRYPGGETSLANMKINSVKIRRTPGCAKLDAPTATPGVGSASISWTAGSESAWNLQYKLASAPLWTSVTGTITNPFTLDGLEQGTSYKVRVQADCGGGDLGDWSDETTFTTNCDAINVIPFTETFDAALSNCWDVTDENTEYYVHSVFNGELRLPGGKTASGHLVKLPEISASLANATMTITYKSTTGTNTAVPQVGYMDGENFAELAALDKSNSFKTAYVPLATATGRLALRYDDGTSEGNFDIDEIRISHVEIFEDLNEFESGKDNQTRLSGLNGQTIDAVLTRSLWRNGDYGTISLPFDLNAAQLADEKCPLNGFVIREYKSSEVNTAGDIVDIYLKDVSAITAGKAYFVRYDGSLANLSPLEFRDVTVSRSTPVEGVSDGSLQLFGLFNPLAVVANDKGTLFVGSGNALNFPNVNGFIKGFRAYFTVPAGSPMEAPIRHGARVRISEPNNAPTGIEDVQGSGVVQSIKVLEKDQVVIIRNGAKYNVQGQKIQ